MIPENWGWLGPEFLSWLASRSVRAHSLTSSPFRASINPMVIPQLVVPMMATACMSLLHSFHVRLLKVPFNKDRREQFSS